MQIVADVMATASTATPKRKAKKKETQHHKDLQQQAREDSENAASDAVEIMKGDGTSEKSKRKRAVLKNQDLVQSIDGIQGEILKNGQVAKSMASSLQKVLVASTTSPSSKSKCLAKVSEVEAHLTRLREERRKMINANDPQDEIDEQTKEIEDYTKMKRNLNRELFDAEGM